MKTIVVLIFLFTGCLITLVVAKDAPPTTTLVAAEKDILEIARAHSFDVIDGNANLASVLADIPHPWSVPKIIDLFQKNSTTWLAKLQHQWDIKSEDMWDGWQNEEKRCGYLATLLALSRDPRAAVVLGKSIEDPDCPGYLEAMVGLLNNFVGDSRYHQLPAENGDPEASIQIWDREVKAWWKLNKADLEVSIKASTK
jgi:hypothetical protein